MERDFYTDEFEQLIKEKADQFRMYPSRELWHSIWPTRTQAGDHRPIYRSLLLLLAFRNWLPPILLTIRFTRRVGYNSGSAKSTSSIFAPHWLQAHPNAASSSDVKERNQRQMPINDANIR